MSFLGPADSPASRLAAEYRQSVHSKLPPATLLPSSLLTSITPGSNVTKVPETCGLLTEEEIVITQMDATELVGKLAEGKLTSVKVVEAFGKRASIAHQLVCCLTDFWLDEALVRAKALDDHYTATGKTVGPLHGLPISLKDQVQVQGRFTTLGFLSLHAKAQPEAESAQLAKILQDAGAVFFCHTTIPQTIMHLECESFWGRTLNPYNTSLSAGGSSGGEGALIAMRGSPIGVGTDIGGSVRSPAANCSLYGLRPTTQRVPNKGVKTYVPGRDSILGVVGPLAHSLQDVDLFMSVVMGSEPWRSEPALLEMPWTGAGGERRGDWEGKKRKLRVGVMWDDGEVRPVEPVRRALENVVKKLEASGEVEISRFEAWESRKGWELIRQLYFIDGGRRVHELMRNESFTEPLHPLSKWLMEESGPPVEDITDSHRLWEVNLQREKIRSDHATHWNKSGIDVLLCPAAPVPASPHGEAKWWTYTSMFNLVDYPCIAFPSGYVVDLELDRKRESPSEYVPLSADDKYLHDLYEVERFEHAPIPLQLVARKYHDEECLEALKLVEAILKRSEQ